MRLLSILLISASLLIGCSAQNKTLHKKGEYATHELTGYRLVLKQDIVKDDKEAVFGRVFGGKYSQDPDGEVIPLNEVHFDK